MSTSEQTIHEEKSTVINDDVVIDVKKPNTSHDQPVLPSEKWEALKNSALERIQRKLTKIKVTRFSEIPATATLRQKIVIFFSMLFKLLFGWCMPKRRPKKSLTFATYDQMTNEQQHEVHKILMDIAYALTFYGSAAYRVEYHLTMIANHFNMAELHFTISPNQLFFSFKQSACADALVQFVDIKSTAIDMTRLSMLDDLARALAKGKVTLEEAKNELKAIIGMKPKYLWLSYIVTIFFNSMVGGVFAIFFDCLWVEIIASIASGFVVGLIMTVGARFVTIARSLRFVAGLFATLVGVITKAIVFGVNRAGNNTIPANTINEVLIFLSGSIILLPGISFYVAMAEIASQHIASGTSRLISAGFNLLQLGFGMLVAVTFSDLVGLPVTLSVVRAKFPAFVYFLALPGVFIGVLFLLKTPTYPFVFFFVTIASYASYSVSFFLSSVLGREVASLFGAFIVCVVGNIYNRVCSHPSNIVITNSIIMLLPGSLGVRTLQSLFTKDSDSGVGFAYTMIMSTVALTVGFVLGNYIVPPKHRLKL